MMFLFNLHYSKFSVSVRILSLIDINVLLFSGLDTLELDKNGTPAIL